MVWMQTTTCVSHEAMSQPTRIKGKSSSIRVIDFKTKEFTDPKKVEAYDEHLMQLAAYRIGLNLPKARCANVFVSVTEPGLVVVKEWEQEELERGWVMFESLLNYWQAKNKHK